MSLDLIEVPRRASYVQVKYSLTVLGERKCVMKSLKYCLQILPSDSGYFLSQLSSIKHFAFLHKDHYNSISKRASSAFHNQRLESQRP